ncbi:hypothetical protein EIP91_004002, partial [Steccherinum ochraceum]
GTHESSFPTPGLEYWIQKDGSAALSHVIQVRNETASTWYEAFVDAHSGEVISVVDFVAHATYRVLPIHKQVPTDGFETLVDPADPLASPEGWNGDLTRTLGNNAISYRSSLGDTTGESDDNLTFIYDYDFNVPPDDDNSTNVQFAEVNAFYVVNTMHDITYRYGFTESNYNFQNDNFGKGGDPGADRVLISVQDSGGMGNAFFSTPPDGQSPTLTLELAIAYGNPITFTHGVSNRMTGGGTGRCLQTLEASGMGEGWSDSMADWTEQTADMKDWYFEQWISNDAEGTRTHPYSTSMTTNPLVYADVTTVPQEAHYIGEIWANMLHNVHAALIDAHGFSTTANTNPDGTEGNIVWLHLFIDSFPIQPCQPTFVTARDAWIQADVNRYNGANKCTLWKAFSSRGLGPNAQNYTNDFSVPDGC